MIPHDGRISPTLEILKGDFLSMLFIPPCREARVQQRSAEHTRAMPHEYLFEPRKLYRILRVIRRLVSWLSSDRHCHAAHWSTVKPIDTQALNSIHLNRLFGVNDFTKRMAKQT